MIERLTVIDWWIDCCYYCYCYVSYLFYFSGFVSCWI